MHFRRTPAIVVALAIVSGWASFAGVPIDATAQQPNGAKAEEQAPPQERKSGNPITDWWITLKIHSQFVTEDALEDSDIDVDTNAGAVTLSGTVASESGRARAMAIAKATDGVKGVTDKLRIAPAGGTNVTGAARETGKEAAAAARGAGRKVTDGWIKSKIYTQFLTESALDDSDIDVDVIKGAVTLSGTVRSEAGRQRAVAIAKATDGVKNVKDSLKVAAR